MTAIAFEIVTDVPVDAVVALYEAGGWWTEEPRSREIIPAMVRGSFCFMVARDGERYIGMGRALSDGVSDAYIQDVVVLKEYRGRGIGAELVRRLAQFCADRGLPWIGLVAEPGTRHFYTSLGFRPLERYEAMRYFGAPDAGARS